MQPPAGLPHTHPRPVHWLLTALLVAAVLTAAVLLDPGDATAGAGRDAPSAPFVVAPDPTAVRYPLDCGTVGTELRDRAVADLDGDGRPETVAVVSCRAGAGTPPDGVYVLAAGKGTGAPPRVVATLVDPARRVNVSRFTELFQRCRSRVRTARAIADIRFGLHRALRKIRQDFRRATPRSTGARAAESARLTVRWVGDRSPPGGRLTGVVTHGPAPR